MTRPQVVEVKCSRCTRVEHKPADETAPCAFYAKLGDKEVLFEDLCDNCRGVVDSCVEQIARPISKASRGKRSKG